MNEFDGRFMKPPFPISFCRCSSDLFTHISVSLIGICSRCAVSSLKGFSNFDLLALSFLAAFRRLGGEGVREKALGASLRGALMCLPVCSGLSGVGTRP